nr:electron transfer flavoprotein subunit beta/FixA family protein [Actinomycetota bacterium]NIU65364.1 electron transfer flavoprotein subunit beta/FixA family protein [Actinomycetota bacterium]NIV86356.1 electron transfer flavoprotein subunit beta/FixA family protein [Actinomycetota bacterium]NIW27162.1 electron transfer flavoprotein subunit beta/FixA family protein [Actinomycetota bacterium]NIX19713.1 electron transfer flavoprotein subunit beta/FixA family protein [Actinomycetota bacterium]
GLEAGDIESAVELTDMFVPEAEGDTEYLEGGADEQAAALASVLREEGVGAE